MNFSIDFKNILNFFTKFSFKISFFIGIVIYRFILLDRNSEISITITNILLTISVIFLIDEVVNKIFSFFNKKIVTKKYKKELENLSEPQIKIFAENYLIFEKNNIEINPTAYFNIQDGIYQILLSKLIIFQAAKMQQSFEFPFTLQEWAYKEIDAAINNGKIRCREDKKEYVLNWYKKEVHISKSQYREMEYEYYA